MLSPSAICPDGYPAPVRQTDTSAGSGNALQACVASILNLPLDQVPNFIHAPQGYETAIADFARERKVLARKVLMNDLHVQELDNEKVVPVGAWVILRGKSPRGSFGHVVVAQIERSKPSMQFKIVHDPYPGGEAGAGLDTTEPYGWCIVFSDIR